MVVRIVQGMAVHRVCVCVFGWEQVCVYICIYVGVCVYGYMSTGAVAIASLRRLKDKLSCQFLISYSDMITFL